MEARPATPRVIGRYALYGEIASGGMATVHLGRLLGPVGFSRTVAIKRLHPQFAKDPEFVAMFLDEARLAARIRHPNVVSTLDVVASHGELFLVMDYVQGESLSRIVGQQAKHGVPMDPRIALAVICGTLHGLHAAHEAVSEQGQALGIVHRDVSPQNVLVGVDGIARVLDFGVAKAVGRIQTTRDGQLKGKLSYMAPEQIRGQPVSRRTDIYAASVVLWEALTLQRLFRAENEGALLAAVLDGQVRPPGAYVPLPHDLDDVVLRGLAYESAERFATAREMALALERCHPIATATEVGAWVESFASKSLHKRLQEVHAIERGAPLDSHGSEGAAPAGSADLSPSPAAGSRPRRSLDDPMDSAPDTTPDAAPGWAPSQRTGLSLPGRRDADRGWSRGQKMVIVGALLAGGAGAVLLSRVGSAPDAGGAQTAPGTAAPSSETGAATAPAPTASAVATASASALAPSAAPASSALPVSTAEPAAKGAQRSAGSAAPRASTAPARPAPSPGKGADCSPPYTVDKAGIRIPKPQCL